MTVIIQTDFSKACTLNTFLQIKKYEPENSELWMHYCYFLYMEVQFYSSRQSYLESLRPVEIPCNPLLKCKNHFPFGPFHVAFYFSTRPMYRGSGCIAAAGGDPLLF